MPETTMPDPEIRIECLRIEFPRLMNSRCISLDTRVPLSAGVSLVPEYKDILVPDSIDTPRFLD